MGWKDKGDERGKKYAVYKDLERRYAMVLREKEELREELAARDATIRTLAKELASLVEAEAGRPKVGPPMALEASKRVPDAVSEQEHPGLAKAGKPRQPVNKDRSISDILAELAAKAKTGTGGPTT